MHLPGIGMGEARNSRTYGSFISSSGEIEQQIDAILLISDPQMFLPTDEGKVAAEFQQELFQLVLLKKRGIGESAYATRQIKLLAPYQF
ncbi:MAG: hypothetical protein KDA84_07740 [Planctomycetaceae bacterium]|nr:hypothetical protein [Planctomycetaceae bacterium]